MKSEEIEFAHIKSRSVNESMEKQEQIASLLTGAATALDSQWCEKDTSALRELAKTFTDSDLCCKDARMEFADAKAPTFEYLRCAKCKTSFGSATGFLIKRQIDRREKRELLIENSKLKRDAWSRDGEVEAGRGGS